MKDIAKIMAVVILLSGFIAVSTLAEAVSVTASATATVSPRESLAISETRGVLFGTFSVGPTGGMVYTGTSDTTNEPRATGDVILKFNGWHGIIKVEGEPTAGYVLTYPNTITLQTGLGDTMNANLTISEANGAVIPSLGYKSHEVEGSLNVGGGQAQGTYTGTYVVTATYY